MLNNNDTIINNTQTVAEFFSETFRILGKIASNETLPAISLLKKQTERVLSDLKMDNTTALEVKKLVDGMKNKRSSGYDTYMYYKR